MNRKRSKRKVAGKRKRRKRPGAKKSRKRKAGKKRKVNKASVKYKMRKAKWLAKLSMWEAINGAAEGGKEMGEEECWAVYQQVGVFGVDNECG